MADEETEDGEDKILGKKYLFPIISANDDDKKEAAPLFSSVSLSYSQENESLHWLSNKSYKDVDTSTSNENRNEICSKLSKTDKGQNLNYNLYKSSSSNEEEEMAQKKKHGQKMKKHKKHKHKKQKHHKKIKSKEEAKLTKLPSTIWIEESGCDLGNAFRIDKKPDNDNISFGGLYRLDIALHKLNPKWKCLGITPGYVINLNQNPKKKQKQESQERYWVNRGGLIPNQSIYTTTNTKGSYGFSKNFSYVPLQLPISVDEEGEETCKENVDLQSSELILKIKYLNKRVRENPNDIESWLALVDIQSETQLSETFSEAGLEKHKKLNKLELEKKAAVLEQAVEKNPLCVDLILKYMSVCVETMSSEKIAEKWKNILFTQPQKTQLWEQYLLFCQSNFSTFSFSNTLAVYSKCFTTLSSIKDGNFKSHSPDEDIEERMVEIFVQFCQFLKQAGHMEKAVAAFQALIEFICFYPKCLGEELTTVRAVSFFENFWDSDLPRFGESNASGWENFLENKSSSNEILVSEIFANDVGEEGSEQDHIITSGLEKPLVWVNLEILRETEQWQPKKNEDEDIEDPDRIVLFQDISSSLFKISSESLKYQLVCYFLVFLGVPMDGISFCDSQNVQLNNIMEVLLEDKKQLGHLDSRNGCRFCCWSLQFENSKTGSPALRMFIRNIFSQSLKCFSGQLQSMFVYHWLTFEKDILLAKENTKQRKQCYKIVRKLAKSLLKLQQHCNDLRLWMAFVHIEWVVKNTAEARRIVSSTLQQTQAVVSTDQNLNTICYSFVRSYCEMEMMLHDPNFHELDRTDIAEEENKNRILGTIGFMIGTVGSVGSVITPAQTLKTHRTLQEMSTQMYSEQTRWDIEENMEHRGQLLIDFNICYALFEYWSLGIDSARSVLDSLLSFIVGTPSLSRSKYHEQILVFYCKLLQFHSKNRVCPVRRLRELLSLALKTFPESAFFLHSYVTLELRSHVAINIRRFFDHVLPSAQTPVPWLSAVLYEKRRRDAILSVTGQLPENLTTGTKNVSQTVVTVLPVSGVVNRLRSLYEKAIAHPSSRHCIALWRSYINFEAENGNLRQAKSIFYQCLQHCAWAKVLYLDAVKLFPESLQDFYDMMEEKELRIRVPLDEFDLLLET